LVEQLLNIRQLKTKNKAKDMVVLFIISAHQRKDTKIILQKYFIFLNNPAFIIKKWLIFVENRLRKRL